MVWPVAPLWRCVAGTHALVDVDCACAITNVHTCYVHTLCGGQACARTACPGHGHSHTPTLSHATTHLISHLMPCNPLGRWHEYLSVGHKQACLVMRCSLYTRPCCKCAHRHTRCCPLLGIKVSRQRVCHAALAIPRSVSSVSAKIGQFGQRQGQTGDACMMWQCRVGCGRWTPAMLSIGNGQLHRALGHKERAPQSWQCSEDERHAVNTAMRSHNDSSFGWHLTWRRFKHATLQTRASWCLPMSDTSSTLAAPLTAHQRLRYCCLGQVCARERLQVGQEGGGDGPHLFRAQAHGQN